MGDFPHGTGPPPMPGANRNLRASGGASYYASAPIGGKVAAATTGDVESGNGYASNFLPSYVQPTNQYDAGGAAYVSDDLTPYGTSLQEAEPPNVGLWTCLSLTTTLVCLPFCGVGLVFGLLALLFSLLSRNRVADGRLFEARRFLTYAKLCIALGVVLGAVLFFLALFLDILFGSTA